MTDRFLLDVPFASWTTDLLNTFLEARVSEDDRIEYKKDFSDTIQDSLVSFANGEGGYIFIGVEEVAGRKTPKAWFLLDSTKDNAGTLYNKAGSETSPVVRPQVRTFTVATTGKEVVVAKVDAGDTPPYFAKQRGVKIRVGDTDVAADPRALEMLFARRRDAELLREQPRQILRSSLAALVTELQERSGFILGVYLAPYVPLDRLRFNESSSDLLRKSARTFLQDRIDLDLTERRTETGVEIGVPNRNVVSIDRKGGLRYIRVVLDPDNQPNAKQPVRLVDIAQYIYAVLLFAEDLYPKLFEYEGSLYTGLGLNTRGDRDLEFPIEVGRYWVTRPSLPEPFRIWSEDDFRFRVGDNPVAQLREMLKSLCWRFGYDGYSSLIDAWGKEEERARAGR